jgi:hypothetical protein
MTARCLSAVLVVAAFCHTPPPAWAKAKHTHFKDAVAQSETIVVARLPDPVAHLLGKGDRVKLDVLQVLKGKLPLGRHEVRFEDMPHGGADEFVAFLDKGRVWRFTAAPLKGKKVDRAVLAVSGFYDSNAHWVTPGLVTLEQLRTYINWGALVYHFRGDVYFPQPGKGDWKPGTLRVTGSYDWVRESAVVKGLPALDGFPPQPKVSVGTRGDAQIDLEYTQHRDRPLYLQGQVVGLDPKTGEMLARFVVTSPEVLTQKTLEEYLADARLGSCYYPVRLICDPPRGQKKSRVLTLTLDKESGEIGELHGHGKGPLRVTSWESDGQILTMTAGKAPGTVLVLTFRLAEFAKGANAFRWSFRNNLLYHLYCHPVLGAVEVRDGGRLREVMNFRALLDPVAFVPNVSK